MTESTKENQSVSLTRDDQPISFSSEDLLNREKFADTVAKYLLAEDVPNPFVIAINASWGAGKSSLFNLIQLKLQQDKQQCLNHRLQVWQKVTLFYYISRIFSNSFQHDPEECTTSRLLFWQRIIPIKYLTKYSFFQKFFKLTNNKSQDYSPIIIQFNPWLFESVEELIHELFSQISSGIGKSDNRSEFKKISTSVEKLGELSTPYSPEIGWIFRLLGKMSQIFYKEKNLNELNLIIRNQLKKLDRNIIVFIDDIDRLESHSVKLLFRMIRLNLQLPKFIFVLAYDRSKVEKFLDDKYSNSDEHNTNDTGRNYLEKIVQVTFDLPFFDHDNFTEILSESISYLLEELGLRIKNQNRWFNDFELNFYEYFSTIRQIKIYLNTLRLTLPIVKNEVNVIDFLAIELFRMFHPEIYQDIAKSKSILAHSELNGDKFTTELKDKLNSWFDEISKKIKPELKIFGVQILQSMFPQIKTAQNKRGIIMYTELTEWQNEGRICSPEVFEKYFMLDSPSYSISEMELEDFIRNLNDRDRTEKTLKNMEVKNIIFLLRRIRQCVVNLDEDSVIGILDMLFKHGDFLDLKIQQDNTQKVISISQIINRYIRKFQDLDERSKIFYALISRNTSVYTIVKEVSQLKNSWNNPDLDLVSTKNYDWKKFQKVALELIESNLKSGELWKVAGLHLPYILYRWREWTTDEYVKNNILKYIEIDNCFISFVFKFCGVTCFLMNNGPDYSKITYMNREDICEFFDLKGIEKRCRDIISNGDKNSEKAKMIIELIESSDGTISKRIPKPDYNIF